MKMKSESEVAQSCPTHSDPMDCSPPGSSVHGIFQARVLEWGASAFSNIPTTIYKIDNQQGPTVSTEDYTQYSIIIFKEKESEYICGCIFI